MCNMIKSLEDLAREDVFDTRDLQERLDDLLSLGLADMTDEERAYDFENEVAELELLLELRDEIGDTTFLDGEAMIRESYLTDYFYELCIDIGDVPKELPYYIENNIDWKGVADYLLMDYSEVEIDGVTFYYRNC